MGRDAPAEHIIATLSSIVAMTFMPFPGILFHRLSVRYQRKILLWLALTSAGIVGVMNTPAWMVRVYDDMHPKRLGIHLQYNVSHLVPHSNTRTGLGRKEAAGKKKTQAAKKIFRPPNES